MLDIDAQTALVVGVVGLVAGWLALVVTGGGLTRYLAAGLVGAFLGNLAVVAVHIGLPIGSALVMQVASAAIGALATIALTRVIART